MRLLEKQSSTDEENDGSQQEPHQPAPVITAVCVANRADGGML
jgi:hypothetical protein